MRSRSRVRALAAGAVLAAAVAVVPAGAATAAPVLVCDDGRTLAHQRIVGDVRLELQGCTIDTTTITGDLVVATAPLLGTWVSPEVEDSMIKGDLVLEPGTSATFVGTSVLGGVHLHHAAYLGWDGYVRHSVRGDAYRSSLHGRVEGAVNITSFPLQESPAIDLARVHVGGWVNLVGGYHQVQDSRLDRGLTSKDAATGVAVCSTSIAADVLVTRAHGRVGLGGTEPRPGPEFCDAPSDEPVTIGGSLSLIDNRHSIFLMLVTVAGDLACTGNTGPLGVDTSGATVQGTRSGQCA